MNIDIRHLEFIHIKLRTMLVELEEQTGIELTITSIYRINNAGVHGTLPVRGIDCRCRDDDLGQFIADWINDRWVYDPARPGKHACIYHDVGSGWHLHFQVHPNTERA